MASGTCHFTEDTGRRLLGVVATGQHRADGTHQLCDASRRRDQAEDVRLHDDLLGNGHMSPTGHQATPIPLSGVAQVHLAIYRRQEVQVQWTLTGQEPFTDGLSTARASRTKRTTES
jgi:hypothetical protein